MKTKKSFYKIQCDCCSATVGEEWYGENEAQKLAVANKYLKLGDKDYCPACYCYEGDVIITKDGKTFDRWTNEEIVGPRPVTIVRDKNGKPLGVNIKTLDEDFTLDLHYLDNGKTFTWDEAMKRLKKLGLTTFNEKQGHIIAAYKEEINKALVEAGGEPLSGYYWSVSEYYSNTAWCYYGDYGRMNGNHKNDGLMVRSCLAR